MNIEKEFLDAKQQAMQSLEKACDEKKVDQGVSPLLNIINKSEEYYTSSSCSGRIVLLEIPGIGDKKNARFLGRWHETIEIDEIYAAVKKTKTGQLWLLAQSPIIHIVAKTSNAADKLLKTAIASGFKNSGLKSLGKKIVVEVCSTERLDAPVGKNGGIFCNKDHLMLLVNISNEIMKKSTLKLKKFEEKLRKHLSTHKTTKE